MTSACLLTGKCALFRFFLFVCFHAKPRYESLIFFILNDGLWREGVVKLVGSGEILIVALWFGYSTQLFAIFWDGDVMGTTVIRNIYGFWGLETVIEDA